MELRAQQRSVSFCQQPPYTTSSRMVIDTQPTNYPGIINDSRMEFDALNICESGEFLKSAHLCYALSDYQEFW